MISFGSTPAPGRGAGVGEYVFVVLDVDVEVVFVFVVDEEDVKVDEEDFLDETVFALFVDFFS